MPTGRPISPGVVGRRTSSPIRSLPDFLVIGAQKSGTTSLYGAITAHPDVLPAAGKEVHFFDRSYDRGTRFYRSFFPLRLRTAALPGRRRRITGEATPAYLFLPEVPDRVKAVIPSVRLIAVLRDPVARARSHHAHEVRKGREVRPFSTAIRAEAAALHEHPHRSPATSYLARGMYAAQLERWLGAFARERLLILQLDHLLQDPDGTMDRVWRFLGLPPSRVPLPHLNAHAYEEIGDDDRSLLRDLYARPDVHLRDLLGEELSWSRAERLR